MPLRQDLKKVLMIGSGPIVIGQAAEFDYAGTQACRALKEEGLEVVLVNSNPATIMTDKAMADKIYIEPLTLDVIRRIIIEEQPDSLLSTLGGQTGLTLSMMLAKEGFLAQHNVTLLGANPETIDKAEDRQRFKNTMESLGEPCIPSKVVTTVEDALAFASEIGYPVIVRPAFTLGGAGGGIANTSQELARIATGGLRQSPITQVLIEKCISGWKEIEFEVIRDRNDNAITVCSMENFDPVGVHTGDSIVVAPAVTLSDKEYQLLRTASLHIVRALGVEGGCNVQLALHPESMEYAVIEVNPRVSRSSALASKATGYPIAKVATKIAIGYTLDEVENTVTGKTLACFEPALDYLVVKFPKWPFDKFIYATNELGTQMKATGEVMSIGTSFEHALMKAVRGAELKLDTLNLPKLKSCTDQEILDGVHPAHDERLFYLFEALLRGVSIEQLHEITMVDEWFLAKLKQLADFEQLLEREPLTLARYEQAKHWGYPDQAIARISGDPLPTGRFFAYKMVDTCAGEFAAQTPYFYSTYEVENEATAFLAEHDSGKKRVIVVGSGPIRIGQGIEFDYCSVHCVWALREAGYEAVICNNNPETVSTDFDTGDRLYFDPLTKEDLYHLIQTEQPYGVVLQFGGQTAISLTSYLDELGVRILGTPAASIHKAEDREQFDQLLEACEIPRPEGTTVYTAEEAKAASARLGYPVLLRPSYVLGGQNMIIAHSDQDIEEYMEIITRTKLENPVLVDKYMMGTEVEVDAICDGLDVVIPGIMEHIERAGVHSGDSISVYPAQHLTESLKQTIIDYTGRLAKALEIIGLVNIQYVVCDGKVYVIEVNPRSSRTIPYISKVTGIPMVEVATKVMLGSSLASLGYQSGLCPETGYVAVKVPVFSFEKLHNLDTHLGPEMKSTGEVLGIARTFQEALLKGLVAAGQKLERGGAVFISVRDSDKEEIVAIARKFQQLGFRIYSTGGTAAVLAAHQIEATVVSKMHENKPHSTMDLLEHHTVNYVISTSAKGRFPARDSVKIRRKAIENDIACLTSLDTASAIADCLAMHQGMQDVDLIDITTI